MCADGMLAVVELFSNVPPPKLPPPKCHISAISADCGGGKSPPLVVRRSPHRVFGHPPGRGHGLTEGAMTDGVEGSNDSEQPCFDDHLSLIDDPPPLGKEI